MDEFNFYKYIDEKSILVITPRNKLIRIRCPFAVTNKNNEILQVDAVREIKYQPYYKIEGKYELYNSYSILADI